MLVVGRGEARRHHVGVVAGIAVGHSHGRHDPGQLHLELDGAVQVEVPVEAVLVVSDGRDGAHDQTPRATHLAPTRHHVHVLPEDPVVLLVHADGVGARVRLAPFVGVHVVEVEDLAQAVATERQRVGHAAEAPLACVERALPGVHRSRVPVGHDHLADGSPVQDRPDPPPVLVAHRVDDEALQWVHADSQRPLLPADQVALHLEARALGLRDLERLQVGPRRSVVLGVVAAGLGWERHDAQVEHLEYLAPAHVDEGQQPLERPRVAVVLLRLAQVGEAARDAAALLVAQPEGAGGPGVDLDLGAVDDAASVERRVPLGVVVQGGEHHDRLLDLQCRSHVAHDLPAVHRAPGHRDDHLRHVGLGALQQHQADTAVDRDVLPAVEGAHQVLGRIAQAQVGKTDQVGRHLGPAAREDDLTGGDDLVPRQGGQGVQDGRGGSRHLADVTRRAPSTL